ncbi:hypothetical protein EVAR_89721_1 [Eumeta japonica]|uniref:Integrase zinc-binding domain-containing protein n=1 Tax=Eumeta variegata TaxID=151549 RepID=A0A4C1Y769_EUMVA|nr:hypothetical protein EVAR_89721_1 [Eumeta japonica]
MLTDDWLRVGGRLRRSPTLSFDEKHPIILDGRDRRPPARRALSPASRPRQSRSSCKHHPERFWITRLRPTVKKVANACRLCRVRRAQPVTPKMADLPGECLASSKAIYAHRWTTSGHWSRRTLPSSPGIESECPTGRRLGRYDGCACPTPAYGRGWERLVRSIKVAFGSHTAYQSSEDEVLHTARGRICCELSTAHTYRSSRVTRR